MTSIGIGIGIAAIVAVTGISSSGRADLLATLESLGTNLIKASPQAGFFGSQEELPERCNRDGRENWTCRRSYLNNAADLLVGEEQILFQSLRVAESLL